MEEYFSSRFRNFPHHIFRQATTLDRLKAQKRHVGGLKVSPNENVGGRSVSAQTHRRKKENETKRNEYPLIVRLKWAVNQPVEQCQTNRSLREVRNCSSLATISENGSIDRHERYRRTPYHYACTRERDRQIERGRQELGATLMRSLTLCFPWKHKGEDEEGATKRETLFERGKHRSGPSSPLPSVDDVCRFPSPSLIMQGGPSQFDRYKDSREQLVNRFVRSMIFVARNRDASFFNSSDPLTLSLLLHR